MGKLNGAARAASKRGKRKALGLFLFLAMTLASGCEQADSDALQSPDQARTDAGHDASVAEGASDATVAPGLDRDARVGDGGDADVPLPGPQENYLPSDLVFTRELDGTTTLWAMSGEDLSVRQLDRQAAARPVAGTPLGYSPDGLKLLTVQTFAHEQAFSVALRCRQAACAGDERYEEVLRVPFNPDFEQAPLLVFAPDSSGVILGTRDAVHYVRLEGPDAPFALELSDRWRSPSSFIQGSQAVLLQANGDLDDGLQLIDLRTAASGQFERHVLHSAAGLRLSHVVSMSPDREHWIAAPGFGSGEDNVQSFDAAAVLQGEYLGRDVESASIYATDSWIALIDGDRPRLQRWDGSLELDIVGAAAIGLHGCGNLIVLDDNEGAFETLDLSNAAGWSVPPLTRTWPSVAATLLSFAEDCSKAVAVDYHVMHDVNGNIPTAFIDVDAGTVLFERAEMQHWAFDAHATVTVDLLGNAYRVDTLGDSTPLSYSLRVRSLDFDPLFLRAGFSFLAAGPIEDALDPRIYRLDFSDSTEVSVEPITPSITEIGQMVLSSDDGYLAYDVRTPSVPTDADDAQEGLYERDMSTGEIVRIDGATRQARRGTASFERIPGHRALLITGDYEGESGKSLFVTDLDSDEGLVPQVSGDVRQTLGQGSMGLSSDGSYAWYSAVRASACRIAQPLRFSLAEPLEPAQVLEFERESIGFAAAPVDRLAGILNDLGPVYAWDFSYGEGDDVYYFDMASSEQRVLAAPRGEDETIHIVELLLPDDSRVILHRRDRTLSTFSYIDATDPAEEHVLFSGTYTPSSGSSGEVFASHDRWIAYQQNTSFPPTLHFYDTVLGVDHTPFVNDAVWDETEYVFFAPHAPLALIVTWSQIFALDLETWVVTRVAETNAVSTPRPTFTTDLRWATWTTQSGASLGALDGSLDQREIVSGEESRIKISPNGRWLIAHGGQGPWLLFRTDALDAPPAELAGPFHANMNFDPNERYVVGGYYAQKNAYDLEYEPDVEHPLTVWSLDDPSTPHDLLEPGETGTALWVEGLPVP